MTALGVLFTLIAVVALVALVMLKSKADTATETANVGNDGPSVDSVSAIDLDGAGTEILAGTLTPVENDINYVIVSGVVSDPNGCEDINNVTGKFFRTGVTDACADDNNNCSSFSQSLAVMKANDPVNPCTGAGDTDISYRFSVPFYNFADPTDAGTAGKANDYDAQEWELKLYVVDNSSALDTVTPVFEVASLAAFSTAASINYGTVALGADSSEQTVTFTNTGNMYVDSSVAASGNMTETSGNYDVIPAGNVHYSLTQGFTYGTATATVITPSTSELALQLPQQLVDNGPSTAPTVDSYWVLRMPASGVNGTYSNTLTFTALSF